jgi:hypothetical protein
VRIRQGYYFVASNTSLGPEGCDLFVSSLSLGLFICEGNPHGWPYTHRLPKVSEHLAYWITPCTCLFCFYPRQASYCPYASVPARKLLATMACHEQGIWTARGRNYGCSTTPWIRVPKGALILCRGVCSDTIPQRDITNVTPRPSAACRSS